MASKTLNKTETSHTNAEYRCRVYEVKKNFYVTKMCAVIKNYGEKKTLHIPRRELYVKKDSVPVKLSVGDYVSLKFTYEDRRYDITEILSFDITQKVRLEKNDKKKEVEKKEVEKKDVEKKDAENKLKNRFAALAWSDDEDSD